MTSISIIIPYFDRANTIDRCIRSIDIQTKKNVEVIIVDDHSNHRLDDFDNSLITVIRLESNMGPVAARSFGAIKAKHDYLMFLDSDDELLEGWYEMICKVIRSQPESDIYGFPDEAYKIEHSFNIFNIDEYWKWVPSEYRASDYVLIIKSSAYSKVSMPKFRISEIWYIVQLFEFGMKAHYSGMPIFRYHQDAGNQLSKYKRRHFDLSDYNRNSLCYSIKVFKRNESKAKKYSRAFCHAWFKRFFKECLLSFSIYGLVCLVWGKNGAIKPLGNRF